MDEGRKPERKEEDDAHGATERVGLDTRDGLIALGLTTTALGQASKAQGTVTVGKTKVTVTNATAVGYKAPTGR